MIRRSQTILSAGLLLVCGLAAGRGLFATGSSGPTGVPADFPKDFPIYSEAKVRSYGPMVPANPALGMVLVLQTSDEKEAVLEFYRRELPAKGWTIERAYSEAPDSIAAHRANRRISVGVLDSVSAGKRITLIQLGVNGEDD
jgi:hypothetical protein